MEIHLPAEPLAEIFSYLDGFSLLQAAQVNKSWNVVADRESLWRRLCLRKWCFGDVTREHLCTQLWQQLGAQTWKQFFRRRTRQERCMEWARPEDFIYREIPGSFGMELGPLEEIPALVPLLAKNCWGFFTGDFRIIKYLSGSSLTMDGQGKSILCTVSDEGTLSTWDVQEGIKIWSSPVQDSIIINLATLPEMQLAITLDIQRTLKVWNCQDRDSLAAINISQGCYTLKAFVTKNIPFLMVGDCEGHIYTFTLPKLLYLSKVKGFEYPIQLLHCSPENKWVFACKIHPHVFPKKVKKQIKMYQSRGSPQEKLICLMVPVNWAPENRELRRKVLKTVLDVVAQARYPSSQVDSRGVGSGESNGRRLAVNACSCVIAHLTMVNYMDLSEPWTVFIVPADWTQQIANFLLPAHIDTPNLMGVSDANVIVFGSGPSLFLCTIDGLQLHQLDDHQRDIRNLWVCSQDTKPSLCSDGVEPRASCLLGNPSSN
ncbi:F-box/WD repeat-containing protein 12-like [Nannospalax galili]|uniref:F-box/WD repeat-containing protein 12-like n=1 Tax=Nannospalax galili TaxID=1026970 RepID=UPI00111BD6F0|nr:F-box/WD repeat-containing protein 12-like [Nannospalax galili]